MTDVHPIAEQVRVTTGLSADQMNRALHHLQRRLIRSQRSLVRLEPLAGGPVMTVRASSLQPTARSFASLRGVEVRGYRIRPLPELELQTEISRALQAALEALTWTFHEPETLRAWMHAPNAAFGGDTPARVLEQGQPRAIATVLNAARYGVAL